MKFADIILPLLLAQFYTYAVPSEMENRIARIGCELLFILAVADFIRAL